MMGYESVKELDKVEITIIVDNEVDQMSSSNIAVRMEHTATDLLSHPPRLPRPVQSVRLSNSFKNRKLVTHDQGLRYLRIR